MSRNAFVFISIILAAGLWSCRSVWYLSKDLFHAIGTSKPSNETEEEITAFLESLGIEYSSSFFMIDSLWPLLSTDTLGLELNKIENNLSASVVQLRVFDHDGKFVTGYAQCFGDFKRLNVLDSYPPRVIEHLPLNKTLLFYRELNMLDVSPSTRNDLNIKTSNFDYTLEIYWNKWSNYYSKVLLKEASEFYRQHNGNESTLRLILINSAIDRN